MKKIYTFLIYLLVLQSSFIVLCTNSNNTFFIEKSNSANRIPVMNPLYNLYHITNIYQRNLQNYDESLILGGKSYGYGCANCHTFLNNSPDNMIIHTRSKYGVSMLRVKDGEISCVDSRTPFDNSPIAYSSWHPSGRLIAFSVNKVRQFFHSKRNEVRDVLDLDSSLGIYSVDSNTIKVPL